MGEKSRIATGFDQAETLLIARVIGIDINQHSKCLGGILYVPGGDIQIKQPHQSVEIFGFAVQLGIGSGPEFGEWNGAAVRIRQSIEPGGKIVLPVRRPHFFLNLFQQSHRFAILMRRQIAVGQLKNPIGRFGLVGGEPLEDVARALQSPGES